MKEHQSMVIPAFTMCSLVDPVGFHKTGRETLPLQGTRPANKSHIQAF